METRQALLTRRSIRRYQDRPVAPDIVTEILRAAMSAPSAVNAQPWHFVVIDDRDLLARIPAIQPYAEMAPQAALAVLICADPRLEKAPGYWVQDCSAATENLLLAAHDAGLGAVWTGLYPDESRVQAFRDLLGIPPEVIPMAFVPMGYPDEAPEHEDRFRPDRIHRNAW